MGLFLLHLGLDKGVDLMIAGGGGGILDLMGVEVDEHHRWHVTVVVIGIPLLSVMIFWQTAMMMQRIDENTTA